MIWQLLGVNYIHQLVNVITADIYDLYIIMNMFETIIHRKIG